MNMIKKVISVSFNEPFDRYPDVYAVLESGKSIPIEIEWTTKDFNHDPTILQEQNGLVAVLQNNNPLFSIKQLELDKNKFKKWYVKNSERIFDESIKQIITDDKKIKRSQNSGFTIQEQDLKKIKKSIRKGSHGRT